MGVVLLHEAGDGHAVFRLEVVIRLRRFGHLLTLTDQVLHFRFESALSFIGGIAASLLVRVAVVRRLAVGGTGSIVLVASLVAIVSAFPSAYGVPQLFLLTAFFTLIASGNSVFGLLLTPAARTLGNFSYGIYLLHGIALFVTFNFALGLPQASELSVEQHWSVVVVLTPLLVFVSFLSFKFVEYPAMLKTACLTRWIRSIGDRLRVASRRHLGDG